MSDQLHERLSTVVRQRDEQNALFACMSESVLAVDTDRRIIRLNAAARKLFEIEPGDSRGRKVSEVIRHAELLDIIEKTLQGSDIVEGEIVMHDSDTCLQAHGSPLVGADGEKLGALIVLNNITRLRRLEVMRKDFVANVSHELKTPITSVRGFLDTLIDTPDEKVKERKRFMDVISQQVDRLQAIVEDLLTFSNLEHEVGKGKVELHESAIYPVLSNSIQICREKAEKRNIAINLNADRSITNKVNTQLLERAVTNLIDNAIKYSDEGTTIDVSLEKEEKHLAIRVKDQGIGIPHVHQSRIFERFYCVDKSRSRKLGGTGLGLAIVKHVAIAHRGKVEVESEVEKGSTFSILLPPE